MVIPSSEAFLGLPGPLDNPPWTTGVTHELVRDGAGAAVPDVNNQGCFSLWNADTYGDDQVSRLTVGTDGTSANNNFYFPIVRGSLPGSAFDGYVVSTNGAGDTGIYAVSGGSTFTPIAVDNSITWSNGNVLELEIVGDHLIFRVNGTEVLSGDDSTYASGQPGCGGYTGDGTVKILEWSADETTGGPPPGGHTVMGRGSFALDPTTLWLSTSLALGSEIYSNGAAEPRNLYHVGMLSWGTTNGTMEAYPVTRDLDLVQIPPDMTILYYEFSPAVVATITELTAP